MTIGAKGVHTVKTSGANINIAWSPDGSHIAVGNKVLYDWYKGTQIVCVNLIIPPS